MILINCFLCKKSFQIYPYQVGQKKFCSRNCKYLSQKGQRTGINNSHWKGGTISHGYKYIRKSDHPFANAHGYIAEHRLIMEQKIGRYLKSTEIIHHINHIRDDNRIENLELFKNHSDHIMKYHHRGKELKEKFGKDSPGWRGGISIPTKYICKKCSKEFFRIPNRKPQFCSLHCSQSRPRKLI